MDPQAAAEIVYSGVNMNPSSPPPYSAGTAQPPTATVSLSDVRSAIDDILQGDPAKFRPADLILVWLAQREMGRMECNCDECGSQRVVSSWMCPIHGEMGIHRVSERLPGARR